MAVTTENGIELPPSLLEDAKRYAEQENRPVAAMIEEAVRLYMETDPKLNAFFRQNREVARAAGLTPDEYVQKIVDEVRAEGRNTA